MNKRNEELNPKVTVILTSYNKPETVGQAIESVINQTYKNWELLIMDDASNNRTRQIINRYLNDARITFYNSKVKDENRYKTARYATLINTAIGRSNGEYITYLTDDNLFVPKRLQVMVEYLNQNPSHHVVYSEQRVQFVDENMKVIKERIRETQGILNDPPNKVDHCSILHRRAVLDDIFKEFGNYWDDQPLLWHNADASFWNRLAKYSPFYPISEVLDITKKGPSSFQNLNRFLPEKLPQGSLVKGLTDKIYLIEDGKRREIDEKVFNRLKYERQNIISIPDPVLYRYLEGNPINNAVFRNPTNIPNYKLLKGNRANYIYYIQNHRRRLIANQDVLQKYKFNESEIVTVRQILLNNIPEGEPITRQITKSIPDGRLFKYGTKFYLSEDSKLHEINIRILARLNISHKSAISLNEQEFSKLNCGVPFEWKIKQWN